MLRCSSTAKCSPDSAAHPRQKSALSSSERFSYREIYIIVIRNTFTAGTFYRPPAFSKEMRMVIKYDNNNN